jgi:hypothetical protein
MPIDFTEWATDILQRTHEAARRLNPDATVRLARAGGGVEQGLAGMVDVVEPHDQLVLRPPGSTERSVREQH